MIAALGDVEDLTRFIILDVRVAIDRYEQLAWADYMATFRLSDLPPADSLGDERTEVIRSREQAARSVNALLGWWVGWRDRLFYLVIDWRRAIEVVRNLIPTVTEWTDQKADPEIEHWSAALRGELAELGGVIHPQGDGSLPGLDESTLKGLEVGFLRVRERIFHLMRVGPELAPPMSPEASLAALAEQELWVLGELPRGVTEEALRVLDADGHIDLRSRHVRYADRASGDLRRPWIEPLTGDWVSPTRTPTRIGTWRNVFDSLSEPSRVAPHLRVTDAGRAHLVRKPAERRSDGADADPALLMEQPIVIAEAAKQLGMRPDELQRRLQNRFYPIGGPKGRYVGDLKHILVCIERKHAKSFRDWANQNHPRL